MIAIHAVEELKVEGCCGLAVYVEHISRGHVGAGNLWLEIEIQNSFDKIIVANVLNVQSMPQILICDY